MILALTVLVGDREPGTMVVVQLAKKKIEDDDGGPDRGVEAEKSGTMVVVQTVLVG